MRKIMLSVLSACMIILAVSCGHNPTPAPIVWDWDPNPYEYSLEDYCFANRHGDLCCYNEPCMLDLTAFPSDNVADLKINIERLKANIRELRIDIEGSDIKKKYKKRILRYVDELIVKGTTRNL